MAYWVARVALSRVSISARRTPANWLVALAVAIAFVPAVVLSFDGGDFGRKWGAHLGQQVGLGGNVEWAGLAIGIAAVLAVVFVTAALIGALFARVLWRN